jgi:predicted metal-binding protein
LSKNPKFMTDTEIIVCTTCRPPGASRELPAEGLALFEAVQEALLVSESDTGLKQGLQVRGMACMSGCSRACTLTLQARGKFTYYFGDLLPNAETAAQVIACAQMHKQSTDGSLARNERPERMRGGILARIPPLCSSPTSMI